MAKLTPATLRPNRDGGDKKETVAEGSDRIDLNALIISHLFFISVEALNL